MVTRILFNIKRILYILLILLLGQLKLGSDTIGGHVFTGVREGFLWSKGRLLKTKWAGTLVGSNLADKWIHNVQPDQKMEMPEASPPPAKDDNPITTSDRESILRMLQ